MNVVKKSAAYGKWSIGELMGAGTCNNVYFGNLERGRCTVVGVTGPYPGYSVALSW